MLRGLREERADEWDERKDDEGGKAEGGGRWLAGGELGQMGNGISDVLLLVGSDRGICLPVLLERGRQRRG